MSTARIELTTVQSSKPYLVKPRATLLMCPPTLYDVDYVINPWMAGNVHASSRTRAAEQWQSLYAALSKIANVELIQPEPGSPDMVFTANAGLEHNGIVAISSFFHPERQDEEPHFRRWFRQAGYTLVDIPRSTPFEGEGDALFATAGACLWAGHGPRTALSSHRALRHIWDIPVVPLHLIDPRFYHLDTCFAPLEGGYVMYFPEAFDHVSLHRIEAFYPPEKRIIVREADAVSFACNVVNIGRNLILNRISSKLCSELEQRGFKVIQVELTEFLKAGGAAKCLVMNLSKHTS
jgi:N-dimethylarginine dimethylaminohydrolase